MAKQVTTIILVFCFTWALFAPTEVKAQDEGEPAMKTIALFAMGGGAGGAGLGMMIWLLDPLNPASDFTHSTLSGFAAGTLVGVVLGGMQLQRQAVFPYSNQPVPPGEFDGAMPMGMNMPHSPAMPTHHKERSPRLPLASFQLKF